MKRPDVRRRTRSIHDVKPQARSGPLEASAVGTTSQLAEGRDLEEPGAEHPVAHLEGGAPRGFETKRRTGILPDLRLGTSHEPPVAGR